MQNISLAIIGATGLVGKTVLELLALRKFPLQQLLLVASESAVGQLLACGVKTYSVRTLEAALAAKPTLAIFSAGSDTSLAWAPRFAAAGTTVIDNSAAWRLHPAHKLIVPEINAHLLTAADKIIANPNCSTIQMVLALAPLHRMYKLRRLVISTYQAVTGSGKIAVEQLMAERRGQEPTTKAYSHPIDNNILPHIDDFLDNGYTKEEMKLVHETRKILGDDTIQITATTVRVPVLGGHSMAVNAAFEHDFDLKAVLTVLRQQPGIVIQDDPASQLYPMPLTAQHRDEVFVGRIRRDESQRATLNLWIVADNLRKGAATNAVQVAEYLQAHALIGC
jgi:aspartate-semialdehyde dehydrogenase